MTNERTLNNGGEIIKKANEILHDVLVLHCQYVYHKQIVYLITKILQERNG